MGRRRRAGVIEDLFEIAALLPWWVGVALAVIAYLILHHYATVEIPMTTKPGQVGEMVGRNMIKTVAYFFQYLIPLALLAGAAASAIGRRKRSQLASSVADSQSVGALGDMTWQEFEMLTGEAFRLEGYAVAETGGGGADGGVDLVLRKGNEKFVVQCKQWRAQRVSVNTVRELYGVMAARGAAGGFIVTSGDFTDDAIEFARGRNIELIDGRRLVEMFGRARSARAEASKASAPPPQEPSCPQCGKAMVKRTAKRGANAGKAFWGCTGYPACRGIRSVG